MKNLLIVYNVIFLLTGNALFLDIHHMDDHNSHEHHSHDYEINECQECIIIESSKNYVIDIQNINFSNNNINLFVYESYTSNESHIRQTYLSRAPPISL